MSGVGRSMFRLEARRTGADGVADPAGERAQGVAAVRRGADRRRTRAAGTAESEMTSPPAIGLPPASRTVPEIELTVRRARSRCPVLAYRSSTLHLRRRRLKSA